jgi:hypothetical protein
MKAEKKVKNALCGLSVCLVACNNSKTAERIL